MKEYLTVKQAIKIYNKSDSTIRRLLRKMTDSDRDEFVVQEGNKNLISSSYLDSKFKPRKAVLRDQSNDIVKLMSVTDRITGMTELLTNDDSPFSRAIKAIEKSSKKYDNMTYAMLQYIEQQKLVIENQNRIIDRLVTALPIDEVFEDDKSLKYKKKNKKSKKRKKKKGKIKRQSKDKK